MSNPLPSALALAVINDGDLEQAAPLRNNHAAIQAAVNLLRACMAGGSAGQLLQAADGTDVQWATLGRLATGIKGTTITTGGTTFATGVDLLATSLTFTADGTSSYLVRVTAPAWYDGGVGNVISARLNLDGADGGTMATLTAPVANNPVPLEATAYITPAAAAHTVNVRFTVSAGTGTVSAGGGGAGNLLPAVVWVEKV